MCGIVGYIGKKQAAPILLEGLARLEYRGYDSAGIAVRDGNAEAEIFKAKGRLKVLSEKTNCGLSVKGCCGIGHTRWATHGEPSLDNAHPHYSDDKNVIVVHNGIIENYQELKEKLVKNGYNFYSRTDTEVLAKLVDYYYKKYLGGPIDALARCMMRVRGSYALAVMYKEYPEELYVARKDSPMIIGTEKGETFLASDVPALLKYTRKVYYIGNLEIARLEKGNVSFYNIDREEISEEVTEITWDAEAAEKSGFEHFMMKEIHEQPKAVQATLNGVIKDGAIRLDEMGLTEERIKEIGEIYIVACGSAYHAGVVAQYCIEGLAKIPVRVDLASRCLKRTASSSLSVSREKPRIASRRFGRRKISGQGRWRSSTWSVRPSQGRRTMSFIRWRGPKLPWRRRRRTAPSSPRGICWPSNLPKCAGKSTENAMRR